MSRDRRRFLVRPLLAVLAMMLLVGGGASVASAMFRSTDRGQHAASGPVVVAPPTNLAAAVDCKKRSVVFTWTASAGPAPMATSCRFTANGTPQRR